MANLAAQIRKLADSGRRTVIGEVTAVGTGSATVTVNGVSMSINDGGLVLTTGDVVAIMGNTAQYVMYGSYATYSGSVGSPAI